MMCREKLNRSDRSRQRKGAELMMRLPIFEYRAPRSLAEAARILDGEGVNAMPLAGGPTCCQT
jgi:hypothetical protein